ncbi:hypothetical protein BH10PSE7_BH10PSE7_40100 [soil metagenome]
MLRICAATIFAAMLAGSASAAGTYDRGNSHEPSSLDPHKTSSVNEAHILRDLFEGLVMPDAAARVIPGAAKSWTVSDDGTVYTFTLRDDARWSNGDLVTAEDFVYSFRRLENPDTAAAYASMLYVVKNAEEVNAGKAKPEEIAVKAIDARSLEITLKAPTPYFLELLTHQATYPVHRTSVENLGANWQKPGNLVSNGAFTLTEWVPHDHITITRNPRFRETANVTLDSVIYYPTDDRSTAMKRFETGDLESNDDIPTEQLADLRKTFGNQIHVGAYLGIYYYTFKLDKAPWNDVRLRRAISMAIDRDFLAEKIWSGSMFPAFGMVPPVIETYQSYRATYADLLGIYRDKCAELFSTEPVQLAEDVDLGYIRAQNIQIDVDT